jgi:hypothetical protein
MADELNWQIQHGETIISFLDYLNRQTDGFILKGGIALLACYELDRFSEDIDLDSKSQGTMIEPVISAFCKNGSYSYRTAKDTDLVKRYMVHYGNIGKPLKIEVSFRRSIIDENEYTNINGFIVYTLESLCCQKSIAYNNRDKIRDLYDLCFICKRWWDIISNGAKASIRNAIQHKGLEQFDYIIQTQPDKFIDTNKLADDFLDMFGKLGLLYDKQEKKMVDITLNKLLSSPKIFNNQPVNTDIKDTISLPKPKF